MSLGVLLPVFKNLRVPYFCISVSIATDVLILIDPDSNIGLQTSPQKRKKGIKSHRVLVSVADKIGLMRKLRKFGEITFVP